jgi:hypothetical protein
MGSGAAYALQQLGQHKVALAAEREKVATLEARIKRLEAAEDVFVCPRCGAGIRRLEIPLHQAHEQDPPWNTGFEWCGSCPRCDEKRRWLSTNRTHEECVECALEHSDPPECSGHEAGPVHCADFVRKGEDDEEREVAGLCEGCGATVYEGDERYLGEVFLCAHCEEEKGLS